MGKTTDRVWENGKHFQEYRGKLALGPESKALKCCALKSGRNRLLHLLQRNLPGCEYEMPRRASRAPARMREEFLPTVFKLSNSRADTKP